LWLILRAYFSGRFACFAFLFAFFFECETLPIYYNAAIWCKHVSGLLAEFEKYQSLFPHSKAMEEDCCARKGAAFTKSLLDKVTLLITWLNTVDDLASKITQLGTMFEVSGLPEAEKCWPRPLHSTCWTVGLRDARPVFAAFVKRSLLLRGMKRVIARVWEVCERTVTKTAVLLQPPIASYAHAASLRFDMELRDITKRPNQYACIGLGNFLLKCFENLYAMALRSKWSIPSDAEMDVLTMEALIEDCRDCIEEAVRYDKVLHKYLCYVERWCSKVAHNGDLGRLFLQLEGEWRTAVQCSRHIRSGLDILTCFPFIMLYSWSQIRSWKSQYHSMPISSLYSALKVKERSARLVALLRGVLFDLNDATGYIMRQPLDAVATVFRSDYCLVSLLQVDFGEPSVAVCVLVDCFSADKAMAHDLVTALAECRLPDCGRIIVVPKQEFRRIWNYRRVKLSFEGSVLENIHYLRVNLFNICYHATETKKRFPAVFEMIMPSCSSHHNIDAELRKLAFHRDVCRYVGDSYLQEFGAELVIRDLLHFQVCVMQPSPSPHIPLWASHAFNFIHLLTDPRYTDYLSDHKFQATRWVSMKFRFSNLRNHKATTVYLKAVVGCLAGGTFGTVYKALNVDAQCVIAIKVIRVQRGSQKVLQGEVDIFRNLNHKNLVKYYGCEDEVLIMMEYCSEGTLEKICREGLDEELVRRYTNSLLRAVAYMHSQKVVHRDIKPENIFLDLYCVLKLGDFGCSVRLREQATIYGEIAEYAGTVQYMAPEVLTYGGVAEDGRYRGYGRAVDIWSIGCAKVDKYVADCVIFGFQYCFYFQPPYPVPIGGLLKHFLDSCFVFSPDERKSAEQLLQDPFANLHVGVLFLSFYYFTRYF
uniref:Protein kinase domain-containing protein n=1 Tax=Angiostrongylus cantonensis TaxID=6313 RepID=A0A158PBC9_ANGCA